MQKEGRGGQAQVPGVAGTWKDLTDNAGLNKSEQRHALAQVICTFNQGRIGERSAEAQQFRASGLNLVIAAIVYWNSTYLADGVQTPKCVLCTLDQNFV
jgi:hypothetical protein